MATTTKKNVVTRATALNIAGDFIRANADTWTEFAGDVAPDVLATLDKMSAQIAASAAKKSSTPTKQQVLNKNLADQVAKAMPADAWVSSKWVANNVPMVGTTQKAIALFRLLVEAGTVKRSVTDQGRPVFALVGMEGAPEDGNTLMC